MSRPLTGPVRLLAALVLAGSGLLALGAAPASACPAGVTQSQGTTQDHTMDASDVFTGDVTDVTRGAQQITYDVTVDRVYKGEVQTADVKVTTSASPRSCSGVELKNGASYVFFAQDSGTDFAVTRQGGTARATDKLVAKVERLLGAGHPPTPPTPRTATFTRVAHSEPAPMTRLAAPGVALVIAGLLGLLVVRRVGARR
ncbi:MAG: hypothetical protein ACXVEC_11265 [Nocardioides sp.]